MRIGELCAKAELPKDTVRYYERQGLLEKIPQPNGSNNYKVYSAVDLQRLKMIKHAKMLVFTLAEISDVLAVWIEDQFTVAQKRKALLWLALFHITIIAASNYLVQLPITLLGFHSTWGAFSFPFIFLATDLTVRLIGKVSARRVITRAMLPALVASYIVGVLFHEGGFNGWGALADFNSFVFRIAFASFAARLAVAISSGEASMLSPINAASASRRRLLS